MLKYATKCDTCLFSRTVVSENGYHSVCSRSDKEATECVANDYSRYLRYTLYPLDEKADGKGKIP